MELLIGIFFFLNTNFCTANRHHHSTSTVDNNSPYFCTRDSIDKNQHDVEKQLRSSRPVRWSLLCLLTSKFHWTQNNSGATVNFIVELESHDSVGTAYHATMTVNQVTSWRYPALARPWVGAVGSEELNVSSDCSAFILKSCLSINVNSWVNGEVSSNTSCC